MWFYLDLERDRDITVSLGTIKYDDNGQRDRWLHSDCLIWIEYIFIIHYNSGNWLSRHICFSLRHHHLYKNLLYGPHIFEEEEEFSFSTFPSNGSSCIEGWQRGFFEIEIGLLLFFEIWDLIVFNSLRFWYQTILWDMRFACSYSLRPEIVNSYSLRFEMMTILITNLLVFILWDHKW